MKPNKKLNKKIIRNKYLKGKSFFEQGFTFLEFILVVTLLGLTTRLIIPFVRTSLNKSRQKEASLIVNSMIKSSQSYYGIYGSCIRCQRMPKVSKGIFEVGKPTRLRTRLCVARVTMYVVHS